MNLDAYLCLEPERLVIVAVNYRGEKRQQAHVKLHCTRRGTPRTENGVVDLDRVSMRLKTLIRAARRDEVIKRTRALSSVTTALAQSSISPANTQRSLCQMIIQCRSILVLNEQDKTANS